MTDEEIIAVVTAHKEGKTIEFSLLSEEYWTLTTFPQWDFCRYNYRIKPEPHYRPFKTTEEVMEAIKKHGSWLRNNGGNTYQHILTFGEVLIRVGAAVLKSYESVFKDYVFADGTPFGVMED